MKPTAYFGTMTQLKSKAAGALIFIGATQFIICMVIAEALYPGYSVSGNFISDLGVGDVAIIFNSSVFILGVTIVASVYFLMQTYPYKLLLTFLILCGIGAMGVGIFPETYGIIHTIVSLITFLFGALSAITSYKIQKPPLSHFAVILGLMSLIALVLFGAGIYLGLDRGGMERMIAYPTLLWAIGFAGSLIEKS